MVKLAWTVALYLLGMLVLVMTALITAASMLKLALIKIFCTIRGETFDVMAGPDAVLRLNNKTYFSDPSCGLMAQMVLLAKGDFDIAQLRQKILEDVVQGRKTDTGAKEFPRLSQRHVRRYGYWVWEQTKDFCIDHHVLLHDKGYTDHASLVRLIQANTNKPFPKDRPPWDMTIVPKMGEDGSQTDSFAMVFRNDHSTMDGIGFLRMASLIANENTKKSIEEILKSAHVSKSTLPPLFRHNALLHYLADPDKTLNANNIVDIVKNAVQIVLQAPWVVAFNLLYNERNGLHGPIVNGRKLIAVSESLDLQIIKEVASAFGCTISDVYYSCVVGSCWRSNPSPSDRLRVSATVIVGKTGHSASENVFSWFTPIFPMIHGNDVVARLKCVCRIVKHGKKSPEPIVNFMTTSAMAKHCPVFLSNQIIRNYSPTVIASNLYGPPFLFSMLGCTAFDAFFITPTTAHTGTYTYYVEKSCPLPKVWHRWPRNVSISTFG